MVLAENRILKSCWIGFSIA